MRFFETRLWKKIRTNEKLYGLIHNTIGLWIKNYRLRDRIKDVKENGLTCIFEIDDLLAKSGYNAFVDFGSLLGFVRSGKPLSWDYDIDFGLCVDEYFSWDDLQEKLQSIGFKLIKQFSYSGIITEQTYIRGNICVDFFAHFSSNEESVYYVYYSEEGYTYENNSLRHARTTTTVKITNTKQLAVQNGFVHVPNDVEQYLADVYGENWRTPIPNWEPKERDNIRKMEEFGYYTEF